MKGARQSSTFKLSSSTSLTVRRSVDRHDWAYNLKSKPTAPMTSCCPSPPGGQLFAPLPGRVTQLLPRQSLLGRAPPGDLRSPRLWTGGGGLTANFSDPFSTSCTETSCFSFGARWRSRHAREQKQGNTRCSRECVGITKRKIACSAHEHSAARAQIHLSAFSCGSGTTSSGAFCRFLSRY